MIAVLRGEVPAQARTLTVAWLGVLSIAALAGWLAFIGFSSLTAGHDLWSTIDVDRGDSLGPVVIGGVIVLLVAEQIWPAVRRPLFARAHIVDAGYLLLFAFVVLPILALVQNGFWTEANRYASFLVLGKLPYLPQVGAVVAILVLMDGMNWCPHVANHHFVTLWRLHALHHSQEDMSVLTTFRTHPLIHATYLPSLLPALVLGGSGTVPAMALAGYATLVTLPHANLKWRLGPLGRVVISPAYHRLHHASELGQRGTVNFGFVLTVWDWVAGRAEFPVAGRQPVATGLVGRKVPVEQDRRWSGLATTVMAQLAQPFRRYSTTDWSR